MIDYPVQIYWLFANLSERHLMAMFLVATMVMLRLGRDLFERMPYDISHTSAIGGPFLMLAALTATDILKRGVQIPWLLNSESIHALVLSLFMVIAFVVFLRTKESRSAHHMDLYHDLMIAPLIAYLFFAMAPIIVMYGTFGEQAQAVMYCLPWICGAVFDFRHNRMNQRRFIASRVGSFRNG